MKIKKITRANHQLNHHPHVNYCVRLFTHNPTHKIYHKNIQKKSEKIFLTQPGLGQIAN